LGFFRRERPIHEQLAKEGGLDFARDFGDLSPRDPIDSRHPFWQVVGIHGIPREREWDAVASAEAPGLPGDDVEFVALADGSLIVDEDIPDGALAPLADALSLSPPYHAFALHQDADIWSVAAKRVQVVEVPEDVPGDEIQLAVSDDTRTLIVDETESKASIPSLEAFAADQFGCSFVLRASRLDDLLWEVTVIPL
jgi:hypothetical protein